jgi:hypothetical protein
MHLGYGGPDGGGVLSVSLAEVFVGLRRELLGAAVMLGPGHRSSSCLLVRYWSDTAYADPVNWQGRICGSPPSR